jgi:hypothetical protein
MLGKGWTTQTDRHMLQNQGVVHGRIAIFEMGKIDVFFDILVLGIELSKASKLVNGRIECWWNQSMGGPACSSLDGHDQQRGAKKRF